MPSEFYKVLKGEERKFEEGKKKETGGEIGMECFIFKKEGSRLFKRPVVLLFV